MPETLEFKAELKQLLHLITHSLYSNREIFLRELISNASDALNKVRFDALTRSDLLEGDSDWKIRLIPDQAAGTLTISDNGIGMSRDEVIENLGTVAQSGTKAFLEAVQKSGRSVELPGLIGQFGVGFYSAFMVADTVTVVTRPLGSTPAQGTRWQSDGQGTYTLEAVEKPTRGTDVILHLKPDAKEFLEPYRLRNLVKKFSDFLEFPVILVTEAEKDGRKEPAEEILNSRKAIWLRDRREVSPEEYAEFYKSLTHDTEPPAEIIHYKGEGKTEFRVLAFIPSHRPLGFDWQEPKGGLRLYIQRVLVMDKCEQVLPAYLRFVAGVVDSSDLPLNVSREMLQQNPLLEVIQKSVVKNVLDALAGIKDRDPEKYKQIHRAFGSVLKEGLPRDRANRDKIMDLLLYETANGEPGRQITLAEYVARMPPDQKDIYFLSGDSAEQLRHSPYLEAVRAKGYDVLLFTDPIDELTVAELGQYKDKLLKAVDRAETITGGPVPAEVTEKFSALLGYLREQLPEVADIQLTTRLTDSPACLVANHLAATARLERLFAELLPDAPPGKRTLEINPNNPAVAAIRDLHARDATDPRLPGYARLLYEQAVLSEGSPLPDPAGFARRLSDLIARDITLGPPPAATAAAPPAG